MNIILLILAIVIIVLLITVIRKLMVIENAINFCSNYTTDNYVGIRAILKLKYNINLEELSNRYWEASINEKQMEIKEENHGEEIN